MNTLDIWLDIWLECYADFPQDGAVGWLVKSMPANGRCAVFCNLQSGRGRNGVTTKLDKGVVYEAGGFLRQIVESH